MEYETLDVRTGRVQLLRLEQRYEDGLGNVRCLILAVKVGACGCVCFVAALCGEVSDGGNIKLDTRGRANIREREIV